VAATIREVAREAGVSVATVSRVVNATGQVTAATERRVRETIERLAYVPHGGARSLTTRRTHVIGVVLPETYGDFFSEIIRGIDRVARPAGYHVLVSGSHNDAAETAAVLEALHGRVDGLVLMMPGPGLGRLDRSLPRRTSAILLNGAGATTHPTLRVDNRRGARLAVDHLLDLGHRRIAHVRGAEGNADASERLLGYREALAARGVAADPALELPGDFREESGYAAGGRLADLEPRPTAVFAANDAMAIGCLAGLRSRGLEVPQDVSLVGFDDVPNARYLTPALTTVRVPMAEVGSRATERLLRMLSDPAATGVVDEVIAPTLSIRDSTLAARAAAKRGFPARRTEP
jgi:LacI family transcriptional regulator